MIVCICNNVNSKAIERAIHNGATSVADISKATDAATCCGKCQFKVNGILQDTLPNENTANTSSPLFVNALTDR
ncbi:MAG: (2Fe-2S)-binding protein [Pseudomonadota bacterium]